MGQNNEFNDASHEGAWVGAKSKSEVEVLNKFTLGARKGDGCAD